MIQLANRELPKPESGICPVCLTDETMEQRRSKVLEQMKQQRLDALVIYADVEHGNNFEYLVGFLPRFEEAMLILHQDGKAYMVMGNENLNKVSKARLVATAVHMPHFSLPNQPMHTTKSVADILKETEIESLRHIGLVGWKKFTNTVEDPSGMWDLPYFIVQALMSLCKNATFTNASSIFIGEHGVRITNNANEFAHYEYGASLAGNCMLNALNKLEAGMSEIEVADTLDAQGQTHNVVTIMATGTRFEKANMYPSTKKIKIGDPLSITTGFKGGLQSRAGYAVSKKEELPREQQDYLERVAIPYFQAITTWLETIHIGMRGEELYNTMEAILPKAQYGWSLNPGHLCADEEWLSSPVYPNSQELLKSGMLFQIDLIPSVSGYAGISCESGILLADETLRNEIQTEYPEVWKRIEKRRAFMIQELGIQLSDEILPTSIATAICKPYMLNKKMMFVQR